MFKYLAPTAVLVLSGCMGGSDYTISGFRTPTGTSPTAYINAGLNNSNGGQIYDATIGGVAYVTGTDGDGAKGFAGIMETSDVGAPASTTLTYDATYEVSRIVGISVNDDYLTGFSLFDAGTITLVADVNAGTLTGVDDALEINGDISGTNLSGGVTYRGVDGDLRGMAGTDGVIGAFHGNDDEMVYAGGFLGLPQ